MTDSDTPVQKPLDVKVYDCKSPQLIDTKKLIFVVGMIALSLPIVLPLAQVVANVIGGYQISTFCQFTQADYTAVFQCSISDYYFSYARSVFVGMLCVIGVCLLCYQGYETDKPFLKNTDRLVTAVAGACAIGVALFPTKTSIDLTGHELLRASQGYDILHYGFATIVFSALTYVSLCLFTKTNCKPEQLSPEKKMRDLVCVYCGMVMLITLILTAIVGLMREFAYYPNGVFFPLEIYVLETIMVWAFGISWIVKSQFVLADKACAVNYD